MREIKFRAWNRVSKVMLDAEENDIAVGDGVVLEIRAGDEFNEWREANYIPLQFTGLTDKNGKEIYEGDIVSQPSLGAQSTVVWEGVGWFPFLIMMYGNDSGSVEVIGNIYENPEMVK